MNQRFPYHGGERRIQSAVGEVSTADRNGGVISDRIVAGAVPFIAAQSMLVAAIGLPGGDVHASLVLGRPGFTMAPDVESIVVGLGDAWLPPGDPLWKAYISPAPVGLLFLELATRRRLRVNGTATLENNTLKVDVQAAYPNCPKYIQRRHVRPGATVRAGAATRSGSALDAGAIRIIEKSDTFFVASGRPENGLDASHRGGTPGFVQVRDKNVIRIPDYPGNSMYNTLGNLLLHPRAGLVFMDFDGHAVLSARGCTNVHIPDHHDAASPWTAGTGRYWDVHVHAWTETPLPEGWSWEYLDASPHNPTVER